MSEPNAIPKIEAWITEQLKTDATLAALVQRRVFNEYAPPKTDTPYIVFAIQPGSHYVQGVGDTRLMTRAEYLIKLVTSGAPTNQELEGLDQFDVLIGKQSNAQLNGFLFSGRGLHPVKYVEPRPGTAHFYTHSGSVFQIDAYPAP